MDEETSNDNSKKKLGQTKSGLCDYEGSSDDDQSNEQPSSSEQTNTNNTRLSTKEKSSPSYSMLLKDELRRRIAQEQDALRGRDTSDDKIDINEKKKSIKEHHHHHHRHRRHSNKDKISHRSRSHSKERKRKSRSKSIERKKRKSRSKSREKHRLSSSKGYSEHKRMLSDTRDQCRTSDNNERNQPISSQDRRRSNRYESVRREGDRHDRNSGERRRRRHDREPDKPSYLNRRVLAQSKVVEKRKLLWQKGRDKDQATKSSANWQTMLAASGGDEKSIEKFKKLMGIKDQDSSGTAASSDKLCEERHKQESLLKSLDTQYQMARMTTHTNRGVGFGFSSQMQEWSERMQSAKSTHTTTDKE